MKKYYRYQYKLNTSHSTDNDKMKSHNHTFIIYLVMSQVYKDRILYYEEYEKVERYIDAYFSQYTKVYLNEMPIFKDKIPTIETMGEVFYEQLKIKLEEYGVSLLQLEIGESPVRFYIISDCILIPSQYSGDSLKNWEALLERKEKLCKMSKGR